MNANCYRLVLDKRTGTLVPVAEFATKARKGRGRGRNADDAPSSPPQWGGLYTAIAFAGLLVPGIGGAQVVVDPTVAGQQPTTSTTANSTPLVNIVDPNASGNSVYGDRGAYVSNTATFPFGKRWSAFVGLDAGAVEDNDVRAQRQFISGAAAGVRARWNNANFALTSATPLGAHREQKSVLYANVSVRF